RRRRDDESHRVVVDDAHVARVAAEELVGHRARSHVGVLGHDGRREPRVEVRRVVTLTLADTERRRRRRTTGGHGGDVTGQLPEATRSLTTREEPPGCMVTPYNVSAHSIVRFWWLTMMSWASRRNS